MPTINQMIASSYPLVLAERRKPTNQWAENAFLAELERQGAIKRKDFGPTIEIPLDYQPNPGAEFLATDVTAVSTAKTEVVTAASYVPAELAVPISWTKRMEMENPTDNQKIALVSSLVENAINSHDNLIEQAIFGIVTNGFLGLQTILPDSGQGVVGGIDASTDLFWRHYTAEYDDETTSNIKSALFAAHSAASKGSGSQLSPTLVVAGVAPYNLYESALEAQQRFIDVKTASGGFPALAVRTARFIFSQYGGARIYLINPKSFQLVVSRTYFRDLGEVVEHPDKNQFTRKVYSGVQFVTNNKSRGAVLTPDAA